MKRPEDLFKEALRGTIRQVLELDSSFTAGTGNTSHDRYLESGQDVIEQVNNLPRIPMESPWSSG